MKIDQSKLKNVVRKAEGKITAQCPACAAEGGDAKGEHLVLFKDGKFGCVLYEKDKTHNRAILKLVGVSDRGDGGASCRLSVKPMRVEESTILMKVGHLGRVKPSPGQKSAEPPTHEPDSEDTDAEIEDIEEQDVVRVNIPRLGPDILDADLLAFLNS